MNLLQFLLVLKAQYKVIAVVFLITVISTLIFNLLSPKSYVATTSVLLNYKGMDPVTGVVLPAQLMPGYMATQSDIITSHNVAAKVVERLGIANSPQAQEQFQDATKGQGTIQDWYADLLLRKLDIKPSRESAVIQISFRAVEPNFAAAVANAFAETYIQTSVQLKVEPAQRATGYFSGQVKALRDNLEKAQQKLSKYQQDNGITSVVETLDVENSRLNELSSQLSMAQSLAINSTSRRNNALSNAGDSPDVALNPVIQSLRIDAARAESKLADLSQRVGANHPQYVSANAEFQKIKGQLQDEIRRASNNISGSATISQQSEAGLRTQVDLQKKKVLQLNGMRGEFSLLQKDVETAQAAMDAVNQRLSLTSIEGQSNQSDIAILNPAVAPLQASSPKILINFLLSIFMGTIFGIGLGFIVEMLNRKVRSREDIVDLLEVPVFAVIEGKPAKTKLALLLADKRKLLPGT